MARGDVPVGHGVGSFAVIFDHCGDAATARRRDDYAERASHRLSAHHAQTAPPNACHGRRGVLERLDATGPIGKIAPRLGELVERVIA